MLITLANPIALGLLKAPGELGADIVVGDGLSLGNSMSFGGPGLGFMATTAIKNQDFFLIQAIVFVVALMVVIINIAIDISYKVLDPRIKLS